jgi:hypothetical protein
LLPVHLGVDELPCSMSAVTRVATLVTGVVVVVAVLGVGAGVIAATSGGASALSCEVSVRRLAADNTPSVVRRGTRPEHRASVPQVV